MSNIHFIPQSCRFIGYASSDPQRALEQIKQAGEICYKSESKRTPEQFVQMLVERGHLSVLRHSSITLYSEDCFDTSPPNHRYFTTHYGYTTGNLQAWYEARTFLQDMEYNRLRKMFPFLFLGKHMRDLRCSLADPDDCDKLLLFHIVCDRGISHEIVRHQTLNFTQESTRWINYSKRGDFYFIDCIADWSDYELPAGSIEEYARGTVEAYESAIEWNVPPQIARDLLPHMLKTELIVSGTPPHLIHFVHMRDSEHAHPRIRLIAQDIRKTLEEEHLI